MRYLKKKKSITYDIKKKTLQHPEQSHIKAGVKKNHSNVILLCCFSVRALKQDLLISCHACRLEETGVYSNDFRKRGKRKYENNAKELRRNDGRGVAT